jgi:hypothetical protein
MSIVQKMSRAGWILVGVVIAVLLFPSVATAASTVYNGIIGTSDQKADVSPTSQLLTAEAAPSASAIVRLNRRPMLRASSRFPLRGMH